jgi:hypothetical protein
MHKHIRSSNRLELLATHSHADEDPIHNGVLYVDKIRDGKEKIRKKNSLKVKVGYPGGGIFVDTETKKLRDRVNHQRKIARGGGDPCFDVMDEQGSSIYAYSVPSSVMAGLLMGLKRRPTVEHFIKSSNILASHKSTNYLFLHFNQSGENSGDYKKHQVVKDNPTLETAIESLGNLISRRILFRPETTWIKEPGILFNRKSITGETYQSPHWDFQGWRYVAAENMPWVAHMPLCEEGMMLHVWPTGRDETTHKGDKEKIKLGSPKLVYVAFGDCLLLRADVCHGGCFGSEGNMRFHMVLRNEECCLNAKGLEKLEVSGVDGGVFEQKTLEMKKLVEDKEKVFGSMRKKRNMTVQAYIRALKKVYPEHDTWTEGMLGNLEL